MAKNTTKATCSNPECTIGEFTATPQQRQRVLRGCNTYCCIKCHDKYKWLKVKASRIKAGFTVIERTPKPVASKCKYSQCETITQHKYCCEDHGKKGWYEANKERVRATEKRRRDAHTLAIRSPKPAPPLMPIAPPKPRKVGIVIARCNHKVRALEGTIPDHCGELHCEEWAKFLANRRGKSVSESSEAEA